MAGRESSVVKRGMTYFSTDSSNSNANYRRSSLNDHVDESCRQITSNSPLFYIFYVFSFPFVELKKLNIKNRNPRGIIYNRISTILKNFHHSILVQPTWRQSSSFHLRRRATSEGKVRSRLIGFLAISRGCQRVFVVTS